MRDLFICSVAFIRMQRLCLQSMELWVYSYRCHVESRKNVCDTLVEVPLVSLSESSLLHTPHNLWRHSS